MKRTNWLIVLFMICLVASLSAKSATYDKRWNELCSANGVKRKSADVPYPNYDNPEVWKNLDKSSHLYWILFKADTRKIKRNWSNLDFDEFYRESL